MAMKETRVFEMILGIDAPWSVDSVDLQPLEHQVTVTIHSDEGHLFPCPVCSKPSPRHDTIRQKWRHLDTCEFKTFIEAGLPLVACKEHGIRQVKVPWSSPGSRHTSTFINAL